MDDQDYMFNETSIYDDRNISSTHDGSHGMASNMEMMMTISNYFSLLVIIVGSIGNAACLFIFSNSKLKQFSSSHYLLAISVYDLLILTMIQTVNYEVHHFDSEQVSAYYNSKWCILHYTLTFVLCSVNVWTLLAFSIERYIAFCYPLKRPYFCTVKRAKVAIVALFVAAPIIYSYHVLDFFQDQCVSNGWGRFLDVFHLFVSDYLLPLIVITFCNFRVYFAIRKAEKYGYQYEQHWEDGDRQQIEVHLTKTLIIISSAYLIMTFPIMFGHIVFSFIGLTDLFFASFGYLAMIYYGYFAVKVAVCLIRGKEVRRMAKNCVTEQSKSVDNNVTTVV